MRVTSVGYGHRMQQHPEPPVHAEGVPTEEGLSNADAADQLEDSPGEKQNLSGEARRKQQQSREQLAQQIERETPLSERTYPEDR
jgi:hypothetical protein